METTDQLDELLTCRLDFRKRKPEPATVVIFGASGDLTARKLVPALYHLFANKQLPDPIRIVGFARREKTNEAWREELRTGVETFSRTKRVEPAAWQAFASNLFYCQGDFENKVSYEQLRAQLDSFQPETLRRNL